MNVSKPTTAVIAGAGFSVTAGLPLTGELFAAEPYVGSDGAHRRTLRVLEAWGHWHAEHLDEGPEQYLSAVHAGQVSHVSWPEAVEFVAAVLATPRGEDWPSTRDPRYEGRVTAPVRSRAHVEFWATVLEHFDLRSVTTTNYDLLIERGLRIRPMMRPPRPGIHYGGIPRPQELTGTAQPFSVYKPDRYVALEGRTPLYKLHGSLNWSFEKGRLAMYQDARPAFRGGGTAAIIPPLTEKVIPEWLRQVWDECEASLFSCSTWIVVGYSLPPYDIALSQLFHRAGVHVRKVLLLDPFATGAIESRWKIAAPGAQVVCLPGLPDSISLLPSA